MQKYISKSINQTKNLAKKLAKNFQSGDVLGLVGNLGTGKTHFTKGLAKYFKIKKTITSPTFVLLKPYNIPRDPSPRPNSKRLIRAHDPSAKVWHWRAGRLKKLIHIDCYRLNSAQELLEIGLNEFVKDKNNLVVIEWAEKIKSILPKNTIWINFKLGKKENERIIIVN